ncbi:MAG: hypothetical protein K0S60_83 [Evtepia sp.]|jgi:hypothetical protein|nr:hypothetical protein [Evtepia sp.]
MKNKAIALSASFLLMTCLVIPTSAAYSPENSEAPYVINEYEAFLMKEGSGESNLMEEGSLASYTASDQSNGYIEQLNSLTQYSDETLTERGYSEGNIKIVEKMREDENYLPSNSELMAAAAELRMTLNAYGIKGSNSTAYNVYWNYYWTSSPVFQDRDGVAISWSGDYICDENSVSMKLNRGYTTNVWYDNTQAMIDGIQPANHGIGGEFELLSNGFARAGQGSFTLKCYDHVHSAVQLQWSYGHSKWTISGYSIGIGFSGGGPSAAGSISFKQGVQALSNGVKTFFS